jgi:hypothetical protein
LESQRGTEFADIAQGTLHLPNTTPERNKRHHFYRTIIALQTRSAWSAQINSDNAVKLQKGSGEENKMALRHRELRFLTSHAIISD